MAAGRNLAAKVRRLKVAKVSLFQLAKAPSYAKDALDRSAVKPAPKIKLVDIQNIFSLFKKDCQEWILPLKNLQIQK